MKRIPVSSEESWLELRSKYLSSTEAAALFGVALDMNSPFSLHFSKMGLLAPVDLSDNERVEAGKHLQPAIERWIAERIGDEWKLESWSTPSGRPKFFGIDDENPACRMGTSLDMEATHRKTGKRRLVEIKNVDRLIFRDQWIRDDGQPEPTVRIHLQGQHQMAVTGVDEIQYVPLVGGNELWCGTFDGKDRNIIVKRDEPFIANLRERAEAFWLAIEHGIVPKIDGGEATTRAVNELLLRQGAGYTAPVEIVDLELATWCAERDGYSLAKKNAEAKLDELNNKIKWRLHEQHADADKVVCSGWRISHTFSKESTYTATRKAGRTLRVTAPKAKEE